MQSSTTNPSPLPGLTLATIPTPTKALASCMIMVLAIGMMGALGQIIVHDIIPTFFYQSANDDTASPSVERHAGMGHKSPATSGPVRGDLFTDLTTVVEKKKTTPFYQQEQFVWVLKWTHIHLFGMSMIFIFLGAITIWLDISSGLRTWLVVLPFIGMIVDILAMWLKIFVSPAFFWLHIPGGGLFAIVFTCVSLRAMGEMWCKSAKP